MADQSDKSDSDSLDNQEAFLKRLRIPENSDPQKIAANKLLLNDFGQYPELWDKTEESYGVPQSIHLGRLLEARHNLEPGELKEKWRMIRLYYEELIKMGKLPLPDSEIPSNRSYSINYPYTNEIRFYNPIVKSVLQPAKPEKRRHSDDEPTKSKRDVYREPTFDQLGEESSSQSASLETRPGSNLDTDSQESSKLLSQHDTDSDDSSESKALLESLDRATQTSSSRTSGNPSIIRSLLTVRRDLHRPDRKNLDRDIAILVKHYDNRRPSSSGDSSAAQ